MIAASNHEVRLGLTHGDRKRRLGTFDVKPRASHVAVVFKRSALKLLERRQ